MNNRRAAILYRISYVIAIFLGLSLSIVTVWLVAAHNLKGPLIGAFIFIAVGLFGSGLWMWVSEARILKDVKQ